MIEADDAVGNVLGVREDGRRHDPREVVREEVGGVEARIARAVAPALPILRPPGKEAEATGAAAPNATERLYYEGHYLVAFHMPRVVVVALVERHAPLACGVVKGALLGRAALATPSMDSLEKWLCPYVRFKLDWNIGNIDRAKWSTTDRRRRFIALLNRRERCRS